MENLDATVITPAVPVMAESFGVAPVDLSSGISAYMLTLGVFIPVSGWMAERFGARRVFALAIIVFTLASALCGLAPSLPLFIAARIAQGIGGAMMVPVGRLVVLRETPKERLVAAIAVLTWPALVAPVLGPPLGGLLVDQGDWRWIFWLNLPLGAIALVAALRLTPAGGAATARRFDWPGFLLTGAAVFCLMLVAEVLARPDLGLALAGGALVAGLALLALGVRHLRRAESPMLRLSALRVPTFAVTIWGGSLFRMGVSAVPFLLPVMFQIGFGYDSFSAGMLLMAVFAGNLGMKPFTTRVMRRFGFRPVLLVNGVLNVAMIAACAAVGPSMPFWLVCLILFLGGMTRSMQFTALNSIAFSDIPQREMPDANTLFSTVFQLAMGMGVALGAVAWRLGEALGASADPATPFRIAFLLVAAVSAIGLLDSVKLARDAGDSVARAKA
ncbi:MAG: MFS transporter [Rhodovulum sulfidophilum]|uniref:MFS transporter n=1 Tax=Rhodovulum sulfidophilum TaxID=35806 RepID=A0A2W5Q0V6_RHOSU|nr:MAG: MFS transporter [Rhodovulum sulfidophilum]